MSSLIIPVLAAVVYAASLILSKIGLTRWRISLRDYIPALFLYLWLSSAIAQVKLGGYSQLHLGSPHTLGLLALVIVVAAMWNVLFYIGLGKEKLNSSEAIILLMPIATIIIGWGFTPKDFNAQIAIASVAATATIALIYRPKRVARLDVFGLALLVSVLLMSLENVLAQRLLQTGSMSPAMLYTIRTFILFIIFYAYYRPALGRIKFKNHAFLAVSAVAGTASMILRFYGLRDSGITLTAVALILTPTIVFATAVLFLNEKIRPVRAISLAAVGALIVYCAWLNSSLLAGK